ncbi:MULTISPECIES: hypothetical protein [unclassified Spirosoma]|uniref:hypothetical protein n=1 Tax=unclassified Spirosoma TaxID=2621999 RepID=UPI00095BF7AF|nr:MULTISPECIES: hypothetical protein [unclassified Spirosoma]MBN8821285.1 hypothetical protein [Spirosoma sp.]OJW78074.1 MAG: hypothetical protein BGO59_29080 [Spirosoma sp. 48-14]
MIPFALGQIGLGLSAVFGISIAHITNQWRHRPPGYVIMVVWIFSVLSVFALSDPYVIPRLDYLPTITYLFRFSAGVSLAAVFYYLRYRKGKPFSKTMATRINHLISYGCGLIILSVIVYSLFGDKLDSRTKQQVSSLQKMAASNRKIFLRDTVLTARLRATVDSQNTLLASYQQQIGFLSSQLATSTGEIKELKGIILSLRKSIQLIGRQQANLHQDIGDIKRSQGPQKIPPQPPKEFILPADPFKRKP